MMDKSQEISSELWRWFVELRDAEKNDRVWERLLRKGENIVYSYKGDLINYDLATKLYLAFLGQVERLEDQKAGRI